MPGRNSSAGDYRYGAFGYERDNEVKGNGNSYTTEFRQYDPRLGRWLSLDPRKEKYPSISPYVAFGNNPIMYTDTDGDTIRAVNSKGVVIFQVNEGNGFITYKVSDEKIWELTRKMKSRVFNGQITNDTGNKKLAEKYGRKTPIIRGTEEAYSDKMLQSIYEDGYKDAVKGEDHTPESLNTGDNRDMYNAYVRGLNRGKNDRNEQEFNSSIKDDPRLILEEKKIIRKMDDGRYKYYEMKGWEWKTKYEHDKIDSRDAPAGTVPYDRKSKNESTTPNAGSGEKKESKSKPKF